MSKQYIMKCSLWQANHEIRNNNAVHGSDKNLECKHLDSVAVRTNASIITDKAQLKKFKYHYRVKG